MESNIQPPIETPKIPNTSIETNVSTNKTNFLVMSLIIIVFASLLVTGYFGYQFVQLKKQINLAQITPSPVPVSNETLNWNAQKILALGIEFKLPKYLSPMDYPNGNETKGDKGKQFCIEYIKVNVVSLIVTDVLAGGGACFPTYFGLGATSVDYEAGRMASFSDLQGYTFENGKYYAKMILGKRFEIPSNLVKEIINPNGVKILRIIGKNEQPSKLNDMTSFPVAGTPGDGAIGALINIDNNSTYSGVTIDMKLKENLNTELFDQILSTIKLIQ